MFGNIPIQGSPFFTEVYDPSQIRIGPMAKDMFVGIETTFDITMENAGHVPLEMTIISPSGLNSKTRTIPKRVRLVWILFLLF